MHSREEIFDAQRSRLFGIAYRMLGSRADAEDTVQDAYIRWHGSEPSEPHNPKAWLATVVTRLCIDRLRAAKTERETYTGPWLPEPLLSPHAPSPDRTAELASDISIAFLTVLERLGAEERAAFLLHEVFDFDYSEIAQIIGKSQTSCRQIVHRAKQRVQEDRPRFIVQQQTHTKLVEKFLAAASSGNREQIKTLIAEDVRVTVDGGGKVSAFRKVLQGSERVARLYAGLLHKFEEASSYAVMTKGLGWKDKIAAGFTNSGSRSGDKLATLIQLALFAAQHGMHWVNLGLRPGNHSTKGSEEDLNRLGFWMGAGAQSKTDQGPDLAPPDADLATARHLGRRVAKTTLQFVRGRTACVLVSAGIQPAQAIDSAISDYKPKPVQDIPAVQPPRSVQVV